MSFPAILRLVLFTVLMWLVKSGHGDTKSITFKVIPESIPDTSLVYVSGNEILLGEWNPGMVALMKFPDGSWRKTFSFPAGSHLEYKFTRGSWQNEAVDTLGFIPSNYTLDVEDDTTIIVRIESWKDFHLKPFIDQTYRTLPEREQTAVMGSSLGGLISFLNAWYYPDVFSRAGCVSPAFLYQNYRSVSMVEEYTGQEKNVRIYKE